MDDFERMLTEKAYAICLAPHKGCCPGMSTDEKEGFGDETTGPEKLLEKVKDQTAEVK